MSGSPYPPPPPSATYAYAQAEPPRTGLATGALVLGIVSIPTLCVCVGPLLGLLAVVLGVVALVRAGGDPTRYAGKGRAIGGIITGVVGVLLVIPGVALGVSFVRHFGVPVATIESIGTGLQSYVMTYDAYPPDLETLVATTGVQATPFVDADDPVAGVTYVVGLEPGDPPHWLAAYVETNMMGLPMVAVAYADGSSDMLEQAEFKQALAKFQQEFQAARGVPPTILEPPAEQDTP